MVAVDPAAGVAELPDAVVAALVAADVDAADVDCEAVVAATVGGLPPHAARSPEESTAAPAPSEPYLSSRRRDSVRLNPPKSPETISGSFPKFDFIVVSIGSSVSVGGG